MTRHAGLVALLLATALVSACGATPAPTASSATPGATPFATTSARPGGAAPAPGASAVAAAITEAGLRARLDAIAAVSAEADGFRAVGSRGFDAAADLVAAELRAAGWQVREDTFTTPSFDDPGGSQLVVNGRTFAAGDVAPLIFAPAGDVTGPAVAIDWDAAASTGSGCSAAGYGDLPDDSVVLVRSGGCFRRDQVLAAQQAGAAAFVAGYPSTETGAVLRPTLIEPGGLEVPAVSASRPAGDALAAAAAAGATARLVTHATTTPAATRSIIAELAGIQPDAVVMIGAHLDSVIDGPGANDNASGVASLLAIARALRGSQPRATIRLAFWAAEETGLHGSFRYVDGLSSSERDAILVYLNADMVASPNGFAGVYDEAGAATGSATVRDLLSDAVERAGGSPIPVDLGGGSDHLAFLQAGIVTGGVHSGANEVVSVEQAAESDATAGLPADACYHQRCDDGSDLDVALARVLTTALADVTAGIAADPTLLAR